MDSEIPKILWLLAEAGFSDADVRGVMRENARRLLLPATG